jgi:hypothetical protein
MTIFITNHKPCSPVKKFVSAFLLILGGNTGEQMRRKENKAEVNKESTICFYAADGFNKDF